MNSEIPADQPPSPVGPSRVQCFNCLRAWWNTLVLEIRRTFALDVQEYGSSDGYSVFIALATFAVAESTALTVVAKGEGQDLVVLWIYAVIVILTGLWIRSMLIVRQVETQEGTTTARYPFNESSMRYGRWTLSWTVILGLIMIGLAYLELLPNQTRRTAFLEKDIDCDTLLLQDKVAQLPKDTSVRTRRSRFCAMGSLDGRCKHD